MKLLPDLPAHLRALVAPIVDTADAAFVVSLDCQFLAWGARAQQLFGYSPQEVLGRYCYDLLPARDESGRSLCSVNCPMVTAARCGYSVPPSDAQIMAKDRKMVWVRVSPIVLRAPHGPVCAVLVLTTDVSRYKLAEQLVQWLTRRLHEPGAAGPLAVDEGAAMLRECFPELTRRESEVLWQAVAGDEYHQIATVLNIQPATARNYLQRVLEKLRVRSLRQAILKAALALISSQSSVPSASS